MDSSEWNARYEATELVWTAGPNQTFAAEVGSLPPGNALDLAAGEGRNAIWLAEHGWKVTAVDFSDVALRKAEQRAEHAGVEITTVVSDVTEHTFPAEAFDLVAVIFLHLRGEQRRAVHRRAAAAVAPGGTMIVLGHDSTNIADGHGGPQDPAVLYTPDDVVADLDGTGLTVTKAERIERPVTTPEGEATAIDALVVARR